MAGPDEHAQRKRDHLRIALGSKSAGTSTTGLDDVRVHARALPAGDLDAVDLSSQLWGRPISAPLLLSCMTGGTGQAGSVNHALAVAAQAHGLPVGLGSGRVLLEDPHRTEGFLVRDVAPDVPLLANLGAVQLAEYGAEACRRLVEQCRADGLVLHVNAVQEAVQPGGDTNFGGLVDRIGSVVAALEFPVMVKEVGFGLAPEDVALLVDAGVAGVDVAGAGGTNWATIEGQRDEQARDVAGAFADWGWPTATAVQAARRVLDRSDAHDITLVGSGGLRHGVDAMKVLCLGADLAGVARQVLGAAAQGPELAAQAIGTLVRQLRIATWAAGAMNVGDLNATRLVATGEPDPW